MFETIKDFCLFVFGLLVLIGVVVLIGFASYDEVYLMPFCLEHGYKESRITWKFDRYCIKRLDQTDIVVPYRKVGGAGN